MPEKYAQPNSGTKRKGDKSMSTTAKRTKNDNAEKSDDLGDPLWKGHSHYFHAFRSGIEALASSKGIEALAALRSTT